VVFLFQEKNLSEIVIPDIDRSPSRIFAEYKNTVNQKTQAVKCFLRCQLTGTIIF
jgi:hypothetical protein